LIRSTAAPASLTRAALDAVYMSTLTLAGTGDQTATLNAFLGASSPLGIKKLSGSASVSGTVAVPAGAYVDATAATITQTGSGQTTVTLAAGATLRGGTLTGKATDYTPGTNVTPTAIGVKVNGAGAAVSGVTLTNHAGAGVYLAAGAADARLSDLKISAPALTIPAGDSACFGIYINAGCTGVSVRGFEISNVSIGVIGSNDSARLHIQGGRIHDIPGQHGIYVQNGDGLHIENVGLRTIGLNAVKLQMTTANTGDCAGASFASITVDGAGDCGLTINNTDTALTYKHRSYVINGLTVSNTPRGLYLASVRGATVAGLSIYNTTREGVTLLDAQDVVMDGIALDTIGRSGVRFTGVTNGSNDRVTLTNLRTRNTGAANPGGGNASGVYVNQCANLTIDGWEATAPNGFVDYTLWFASVVAGEQSTFKLRNADLADATSGYEIRLATGPLAVREFDNILLAAKQVLNYPAALVTRVGSVGVNTVYQSSAVPSGVGVRGDICWNSTPAAAGVPGWVCTAVGTWKAMASLAA
jgi:hypothetical protein